MAALPNVKRKLQFKPLYPDVLGAVTKGTRITMEQLQFAFGISPRQAFINQSFEAVVVLQNMVDQPTSVKVAMQLPTKDRKGNAAVIDTPKPQITLTLQPGEVGILRMPLIAHPPTQPGKEYPVRVAVRYRTGERAVFVRPPNGGAPPSVLDVSPFKLQVLRDIEFRATLWNESAEIVTSTFDLAPHLIPKAPELPQPRYESLWTREKMPKEIELAQSRLADARKLANFADYGSAYPMLRTAVEERFAARDLPLHPAEASAIAKIMTYVIDDAPNLEQSIAIEQTRWFLGLCQVLASDPNLVHAERAEIFANYLFSEVLYEAILLGFDVIEQQVSENLGTPEERIQYANRVIAWMAGRGTADLNYIYLPLIMAGLLVARIVQHTRLENPWEIVDGLREAVRGRVRLADGETVVVFEMLNELLKKAEITFRNQRIDRG
ncbi:MAG: hypothetical protein MUF87_12100 [Anaerolineae bacterium]|jgi:hypothetical protein|nr:hypothetical protein [Anaerolineae bacterium]